MSEDELTAEQLVEVTGYVDVEAPPPDKPTAHLLFGTNQSPPAELAAQRYLRGLAPVVIATGGINRHNGIVEGREFGQLLRDGGVAETAIRIEDTSANTWQNVEFALPHLREAIASGLAITAVCKWYHRRAIHVLRTLLPDLDAFYALTWEPIYGDTPITRTNWPHHPHGRHRVLREWQEVRQRVTDGSFIDATIINGAWR